MNRSRRAFLKSAAGAAALATLPRPSASGPTSPPEPILRLHEEIRDPVRIDRIDLVRADGVLFIRSHAEGRIGVSIGNVRMPHLVSILGGLVIPFFTGKDARDVEALVDEVYRVNSNYKYAGMPFWSCVGQVEWSLFDLLGQIAGRPAHAFFGRQLRSEVPVYLSTFARDKPARESIEEIRGPVARTGVQAVKLKIGGRMSTPDLIPGRSEQLIPLARKTFGDEMVLFADANSSYDVPEAIRIGRLLEAHGFAIVEEPCPWEDFLATKEVADALSITVAGGEQDTSWPKWRWIVEHRALDHVQPDLLYNGGFVRATRVARLAAAAGLPISPHAPAMGPEAAMKFQFAAVTPNLGTYQEHREENDRRSWYEPKFAIRDGRIPIPPGSGLGVRYDPELWTRAETVTHG